MTLEVIRGDVEMADSGGGLELERMGRTAGELWKEFLSIPTVLLMGVSSLRERDGVRTYPLGAGVVRCLASSASRGACSRIRKRCEKSSGGGESRLDVAEATGRSSD